MTQIEIVRTQRTHIGPVAAQLAPDEAARTRRMGLHPRWALRCLVANSPYCRTILIDGEPAAMWGTAGALLALDAEIWLVATDRARRHARGLLRLVRDEVRRQVALHPRLRVTIAAEDNRALRFAQFAGARAVGERVLGDVRLVDGVIEGAV